MDPFWGHGPLMWVLFGKNECENDRIGSRGKERGYAPENFVCRSANVNLPLYFWTENIVGKFTCCMETEGPLPQNNLDMAIKS